MDTNLVLLPGLPTIGRGGLRAASAVIGRIKDTPQALFRVADDLLTTPLLDFEKYFSTGDELLSKLEMPRTPTSKNAARPIK
jgi:hypothetical protein